MKQKLKRGVCRFAIGSQKNKQARR